MYTRNQHLFEHDVTRFMSRNGLKLALAPVWQKMEVSIFNLYLAVHERGGYSQVSISLNFKSKYLKKLNISFVYILEAYLISQLLKPVSYYHVIVMYSRVMLKVVLKIN